MEADVLVGVIAVIEHDTVHARCWWFAAMAVLIAVKRVRRAERACGHVCFAKVVWFMGLLVHLREFVHSCH